MVDFVEICNVCARKAIIKAAKRIINSDKMCRSHSDLNFGVTFLEHTVVNSKPRSTHKEFQITFFWSKLCKNNRYSCFFLHKQHFQAKTVTVIIELKQETHQEMR